MLDGLERTNRATELDAVLGVLHGGLQALLGATDLLGGQCNGGQVEHTRHDVPALALVADETGRHAVEVELGLLAGLVHGRQCGPGEAVGVAVHGEQRDATGGPGGHDDEVGDVTVEHEALGAAQGVAVTASGGLHGDAGLVPLAAGLGERQGGDGLAGSDSREQVLLGGLVAAVQ